MWELLKRYVNEIEACLVNSYVPPSRSCPAETYAITRHPQGTR